MPVEKLEGSEALDAWDRGIEEWDAAQRASQVRWSIAGWRLQGFVVGAGLASLAWWLL